MRSLIPSLPWPALLLALFHCLAPQSHGAGVTVITHGFNGDADGWVLGMAGRVRGYSSFPGTNAICYEVTVSDDNGYVVRSRKISGGNPATDPSAEIVIKLDWASSPASSPNTTPTKSPPPWCPVFSKPISSRN